MPQMRHMNFTWISCKCSMLAFPPGLLSPQFDIRHNTVTTTTGLGQIVPPSANRFALWMWGTGTAYTLAPTLPVTAGIGLNFPASPYPPYIFTFSQWGPLVGGPWYVNVGAPPQTFKFTEIIYNGPGGVASVAKILESAGHQEVMKSLSRLGLRLPS